MSVTLKVVGEARLSKKVDKLTDDMFDGIHKSISRSVLKMHKTALKSLRPPKSGFTYKRGGRIHTASAPGEPPATDTGQLAASIVPIFPKGRDLEGAVAARAVYAKWLEFGTEDMEPRPFLGPAIEEHRQEMLDDVRREIRKAVRNL